MYLITTFDQVPEPIIFFPKSEPINIYITLLRYTANMSYKAVRCFQRVIVVSYKTWVDFHIWPLDSQSALNWECSDDQKDTDIILKILHFNFEYTRFWFRFSPYKMHNFQLV